MATDSSSQLPAPEPTNIELPKVLDIQIRRIRFRPRRLRNFKSQLAKYTEAVEFMVQTDGPVPVRAIGPALMIGELRIIEGEKVEETLYRFLAFEIDRLEPRAQIYWGWMNDPIDAFQPTGFQFPDQLPS